MKKTIELRMFPEPEPQRLPLKDAHPGDLLGALDLLCGKIDDAAHEIDRVLREANELLAYCAGKFPDEMDWVCASGMLRDSTSLVKRISAMHDGYWLHDPLWQFDLPEQVAA